MAIPPDLALRGGLFSLSGVTIRQLSRGHRANLQGFTFLKIRISPKAHTARHLAPDRAGRVTGGNTHLAPGPRFVRLSRQT
jgi:hypothetical protein